MAIAKGPSAAASALSALPAPLPEPLPLTSARVAKQREGKDEPSDAQLLAMLDEPIPLDEPSTVYLLGVMLLPLALSLLALLYFALVGFIGWQSISGFIQAASGEGLPWLSALLGVMNLVAVVFLVKPLVRRPAREKESLITLTPETEPYLFEYVAKLCMALGAPAPKRIEVDCWCNAAAYFRGGVMSLFGDDMVLRFGLPLAVGLTVRQFTGVLAHELGHFSQRGGMRGTYLIRTINAWLARIVFQRDRVDEALAQFGRLRDGRLRVIYYLTIWFVESFRGVTWLLLLAGEFLSNGMLRQMEFDADRYEASIAGGRDFDQTMRTLAFMNVATSQAFSDLQRAWETRRLADNLPKLIVANTRQLPQGLRTRILNDITQMRTQWFDTHPSFTARIDRVNRLDVTPRVTAEVPAKRLFRDISELCQRATRTEYRRRLEEKFDQAQLVPAARLAAERASERQSFDALSRFFQGRLVASRPVLPLNNSWIKVEDYGPERALVKLSRERMLDEVGTVPAGRVSDLRTRLAVARAKLELGVALGHQRGGQHFRQTMQRAVNRLIEEKNATVRQMETFEEAAQSRLTAGLRLVHDPAVARKLEAAKVMQPALRAEVAGRVLDALGPVVQKVSGIRDLTIALRVLLSVQNPKQPNPGVAARVLDVTRHLALQLKLVRDALSNVAYPFNHSVQKISVGLSLLDEMPPVDAAAPTVLAAETLCDRFTLLLYRTLAVTTDLCEQVETALGLPPLFDPLPDSDSDPPEVLADMRKRKRNYWVWYSLRALSGLLILTALILLSVLGNPSVRLPRINLPSYPVSPSPQAAPWMQQQQVSSPNNNQPPPQVVPIPQTPPPAPPPMTATPPDPHPGQHGGPSRPDYDAIRKRL